MDSLSLTMMIPQMSVRLDSQMEGLSRHKRILLAGYDTEKKERKKKGQHNTKDLTHSRKMNLE